MSSKRILFIHEDRILSNLYREKLEGSGFVVDVCKTVDFALRIAEQKRPDAAIIDLVNSAGDANAFIGSIRANDALASMPVLALPNCSANVCASAIVAGVTAVIPKSDRQIGVVIDAAKTALGLEGLGRAIGTNLFDPDEEWLATISSSIVESVNQMRHCLPGLATHPPDPSAVLALWAHSHAFSSRVSFLPGSALGQVAAAFEVLMSDLNLMPEEINPSTLRTIGQAIDFISVLGTRPANLAVPDSRNSKILIVDDEDSARRFISEAMKLSNLAVDTAESPSTALQKLRGRPVDLIFLDVGMPEMSGFELCQQVRTMPEHQKTPIVFLTGMATFQNKAQASLSGGNDFVGKPFNLAELALKALMWVFRGRMEMT
jgi:DNA-binding response OmpR family regulator